MTWQAGVCVTGTIHTGQYGDGGEGGGEERKVPKDQKKKKKKQP